MIPNAPYRRPPLADKTALGIAVLVLSLCTAAIFAFVQFTLERATNQLISAEAERSSLQWAAFFHAQVPDIEAAYEIKTLDADQRAIIDSVVLYGDVFRFKMFAPDGTLFYVSDDADAYEAGVPGGTDEPQVVYRTQQSMIELDDGADVPNRPDLYAEAYVPAYATDGRLLGVLEIYTDQTETQISLQSVLNPLSRSLPLLSMLLFLVPGTAFLVMTLQKRKRDERLMAARYDALTQVLNRGALIEDLEKSLSGTNLDRDPVGILFVDVDHFKAVNDQQGHAAGDRYLQDIADVLKGYCRGADILGRYGGDEFVMIMPGVKPNVLMTRASEICRIVRERQSGDELDRQGSVSIGATIADAGDDWTDVLHKADLALYQAKALGRDRAVLYDPGMMPQQDRPSRFIGEAA